LREAVFLWITPVLVALSKVFIADLMASAASDFLPAVISFLTSLTAFLKASFLAKFWIWRLADWRMALAADLVLGMVYFLKYKVYKTKCKFYKSIRCDAGIYLDLLEYVNSLC